MHLLRLAAIVTVGGVAAIAWVDREQEEAFIGKRRTWWAFRPPVKPPVPALSSSWIRNPIDAFILEALQSKQLTPSPELDRARLLRRLTLDVTGLPPTPEEVEAFLRDSSPDAYEKAVERLLASPHYGERWAQRWLDVVRYADTNGYELDAYRPHAWRYRDYVIASFNKDKPYDRFLMEQIAGDELWPHDKEALIATGFHRAGPIHIVGGNQDEEMNRQEVLSEMVYGVGSVFLGMTIQCAKCHNHKFDPISQADYYRLQAIFGSTEGRDIDISTAEEREQYERAMATYKARLDPVKKEIDAIEKPYRERLQEAKKAKLAPEYRQALETPERERTEEQKRLAKDAKAQISVTWDEVVAALTPEDRERRAALRRRMHDIELEEPLPPPTAYAVQNTGVAETTHILKVGDPKQKLEPIGPGLPTLFSPKDAGIPEEVCGRRAALAQWLASSENPLSARVMVNRIWHLRMGTGLVATPNDFGLLGARPSNQKLLDWLAREFIERGWSVKAIDRLILTSSTYRQSAAYDAAKAAIDPDNRLYWRANRRRLDAENLRDVILSVSGQLNRRMGGPPVRVPIEKEVYDLIFTEGEPDNLWPLPRDVSETMRRSIYLLNKRTVRLPMLANFDQPDTMTSCPVRPVSTHALQALSLMNSSFINGQARAFAERLQVECPTTSCRIERAYLLTLSRKPRAEERRMAEDFLNAGRPLEDFCLALLNRNEFVYLP